MDLPEEIIVDIISRLPVKSLLRFTCVSKRWLSIILFDKQFENQHRKNKTLTRRVLVIPQSIFSNDCQLKSLNLETSSSRRLHFSYPRYGYSASVVGSCNGLVFIEYINVFSVYNPTTGFLKELPITEGYNPLYVRLTAFGVGYLPETDDYKIIVHYRPGNAYEDREVLYEMMSSKDQIWRSVEGPVDCRLTERGGILVNETLHWLNVLTPAEPYEFEIVAFDLAKEEFRKMPLPNFGQVEERLYLGACFGRCLCVLSKPDYHDSVDFWVMSEYQVTESWIKLYHLSLGTKLYDLRYSDPQIRLLMRPHLITENYTVAELYNNNGDKSWRIRISHKQVEGEEIEYEETLAWFGGYNGVKKSSQS